MGLLDGVFSDQFPRTTPAAGDTIAYDGTSWVTRTTAELAALLYGITGAAAPFLRASYDYDIGTDAVAASAGEAWVTVFDLTRDQLCADGLMTTITTELTVTDGVETPRRRDVVSFVAAYHRENAADETIVNCDDEVSSTEAYPRASWRLVLPAAMAGDAGRGIIETRWIRGILGDMTRYSLQVREHATSNRVVRGYVYLGKQV